MRVRVMIPTHGRNRDTVVVFKYPMPKGYSSWTGSLVVFNVDLMRKTLIKICPIKFFVIGILKMNAVGQVLRPVERNGWTMEHYKLTIFTLQHTFVHAKVCMCAKCV